eukprot:7769252-Pyramimonas_sp.AAC.1
MFHQLWECPANAQIEGLPREFEFQAQQEADEAPHVWLRGLVLVLRTYQHATRPVQGPVVLGETLLENPGCPLGACTVVATDGSGGKSHADVRLRRCGWGSA